MEECPFCGSTNRREYAGRPQALCAECGSLERQRTVATGLADELVPRSSGRCLELAPRTARIYGAYLAARGWDYTAVDSWRTRGTSDPAAFESFIHHDADATDLAFAPGGHYELFITQHVIEEVLDYPAALDEVARVLEPGGRALLEIPYDEGRSATGRQAPDEFGNVWLFGADLVDALRARFAAVEPVTVTEQGYAGRLLVCRR